MSSFTPAYLQLSGSDFALRVEQAREHLADCDICPRECRKNRLDNEVGVCRVGSLARVSSFNPHMGEESPLTGWRGSGTIFFSRCNLRCQFCQNFDISQRDAGDEVEPEALARIMVRLQENGCHNINFVSPTHVVPQIMEAVYLAAQSGLRVPLVYNTGGYDSILMLKLLDGIVDIYMPDMKYASASIAKKYSRTRDYPEKNQAAVKEMHRQVGDLQINEDGLATRGLLVRHLVLPENLAGTEEIVQFIANEISPNTYINIMDQYRPAYQAMKYPMLNRRITRQEYDRAISLARRAGLTRLDQPRRLFFILG